MQALQALPRRINVEICPKLEPKHSCSVRIQRFESDDGPRVDIRIGMIDMLP